MCGIVGALALEGGRLPDLTAPTARLRHRGPDGDGFWTDGTCALSHRRLAIIDVSEGGRQPMSTEDGALHVITNGEIYNYRELRAELQGHGHRFRSASDTEVLLHAYRQWGDGCLDRLRGMFAFALWDQPARRLLLARDRVGKKPLFHTVVDGTLVFASELQALLADRRVERRPDLQAIDEYLSWGYVPAPRTGFAGISKLPPAHKLVVDLAGDASRAPERWWTLDYSPKLGLDEDAAADAIRERLTEAVRLRMISDVPLGAFLSGGIDSSIVVGLMAQLSDRPVKTFSIGFEESGFDELPHARRIAERWSTDHHEVVVRPDALEILPMLVRHYGEPYADSSAIPTYYVSQIARRNVTVALNGDGGDESFAGYERYLGARVSERLHRLPAASALAALAHRAVPATSDPKSRLRTASRFLAVVGQPFPARYRRWQGYFDDATKTELRGPALRDAGAGVGPDWFDGLFEATRGLDVVDAAMSVDVRSYLPYDLLVKVDITSMASSLEARSPFLDHEVMELAARLPSRHKLRGRRSKHLLLRAFSDLLPRENVDRRKMGFGVPVGAWMRGPMRELLRDALLGPEATARGIVDPAVVGSLVDAHLGARADHTPLLWNLLMLELWHREVVDQPAATRPLAP